MIQIETVTLRGGAEIEVIRDVEKMKRWAADAFARESALTAENDQLRERLQQMLNVAENADETGYVADCGFIDIDKLHEQVRTVLKI